MTKKAVIYLLGALMVLLTLKGALAVEPSQSFSKVYISPFYRASMTQGLNYTYTLVVNPPDGISSVANAMITFQVYFTPTVTYSLLVNGKACNNPSFTISTTYSGAGMGYISYDCSNRITSTGTYAIKLSGTKDSGSSYGWLDLTYMNNPVGSTTVHGTEYCVGDNGKFWLQLLDSGLQEVDGGVCYLDVFNPDNSMFISDTMMNFVQHGVYEHNFVVPSTVGVYKAIATCSYITDTYSFQPSGATAKIGTQCAPSTIDYSSAIYLNSGANVTSQVKTQDGTKTAELNLDSLSKAIRLDMTGNLTNGDIIKVNMSISNYAPKYLYITNAAGTINYGKIYLPTSSWYTLNVTLANITAGTNKLYLSDDGQGGAMGSYFDLIKITRPCGTSNWTAIKVEDGNRWSVQEALQGGVYRVDTNYTFSNITIHNLATSLSVYWDGTWNGVSPDNVNVYLYNYSGSKWRLMPNQITNTFGSEYTVTNTLMFPSSTNLTAYGFIRNGMARVRINDTSVADGVQSTLGTDSLLLKMVVLDSPQWHEVKGSSEAHVSQCSSVNLTGFGTNLTGLMNFLKAMNLSTTTHLNTLIGYATAGNISLSQLLILAKQTNVTTNNINSYLQTTIYPNIITNQNYLKNVLSNQTMQTLKLISIQNNLTSTYNQVIITKGLVLGLNVSLGAAKSQILAEIEEAEGELNVTIPLTRYLVNQVNLSINPALNHIKTNITAMQNTINSLSAELQANVSQLKVKVDNLSINMLSQFSVTNAKVDAVKAEVDRIERKLDCNNTINVVCDRLTEIESDIDAVNSSVHLLSNYVSINVTGRLAIIHDIVSSVNLTVHGMQQYLNLTIYPSIVQNRNYLINVLSNQTLQTFLLHDIQSNVTDVYNQVIVVKDLINILNGSLYATRSDILVEIEEAEAELNVTIPVVNWILDQINTSINPSIINIKTNLTDIRNLILAIPLTNLTHLQSTVDNLSANLFSQFNVTNSKIDSVAAEVGRIEAKLDCNNTVNIVCDKLDRILLDLDGLNGSINVLSSYVFVNVTGRLQHIDEVVTATNMTVVGIDSYLHTTIYNTLIQNQDYIKTIISNQTLILSNIAIMQQNITSISQKIDISMELLELINSSTYTINSQLTIYWMNITGEIQVNRNIINQILGITNQTLLYSQQIYSNVTEMHDDVDAIESNVSSLLIGQQQILSNLSGLHDLIVNVNDTINYNVLGLYPAVNYIALEVNNIERKLDCNYTVNMVCDKLDALQNSVNNINITVNNIWNLLGNFSGGCVWEPVYADMSPCYINDTKDQFKTYLETSGCGSKIGLPIDNGSYITSPCNYCLEDIQEFATECQANQQTIFFRDLNYYGCCFQTGLVSDCDIIYGNYSNQTTSCNQGISCKYNTNPFLKAAVPFSQRDFIDFYCIVNLTSNYTCVSEVYKDGQLLQTNPDVQNVNMYGVVNSFVGDTPIIRGWYRKGTLLPENSFQVKMRCSG